MVGDRRLRFGGYPEHLLGRRFSEQRRLKLVAYCAYEGRDIGTRLFGGWVLIGISSEVWGEVCAEGVG